jgi:hypothetical protein
MKSEINPWFELFVNCKVQWLIFFPKVWPWAKGNKFKAYLIAGILNYCISFLMLGGPFIFMQFIAMVLLWPIFFLLNCILIFFAIIRCGFTGSCNFLP